MQDALSGDHFLHRVGGQGHPEGVADAQGQQATDADGGFDGAHGGGARLGDPQVEGVIAALAHKLVGLHGDRDAGGFQANADVIEVKSVEQLDVAEGGFHQGFRADLAVFGQDVLLQTAPVDADADGDILLPTGVRHRLHPVRGTDIARVDAHLIRPGGDALQGQFIVEVDVHHQRNIAVLLDGADGLGRGFVWHCYPDDLAARFFQASDLLDGGFRVVGAGIAHGLDGDGRAAAHRDAAHFDLFGHFYLPLFAN